MRQRLLAIAFVGALAACSQDSSAPSTPPPPGCDSGSTCYSDPAATPASCAGTWVASGCPNGTALVGMCYEVSGRVTY